MNVMKGRMRPYLPELTIRDYNTYLWYLRGVRHQLALSYGKYSCRRLRYNGVLFALLADSLAGRPATCKNTRLCGTLVWHVYTGRYLPGVSSVRHVTIRLFFPLMELLAKVVRMERKRVRHSFIKVNNELVLADRPRVRPERLLLLLPHCIQRSACPHRLNHNVDLCRRCGQCPVGGLLQLRDRYGFHLALATGGTIARRIVVQTRPRMIIAVACERDLTSGIQDSYPLPVFGILNQRPCGPCLDTLVSLAAVEGAVRLFLGLEDSAETGDNAKNNHFISK